MTGGPALKNSDATAKADETVASPGPAANAIGGDPTPYKPPPRAFFAALRAKFGDWRSGLAGW